MNKKIIIFLLYVFLFTPLGLEASSKKRVRKDEVPQLTNYPSAEISEYRLHGGDVVIKGQVIPQDPEIAERFSGRLKVIMRDYIVNKEKLSTIHFEPDGTFSLCLHVPYPMFVLIHPLANIYACPGDTVNVTIDTTKPKREEGLSVSGTGLSGEVSRLVNGIHEHYCTFSDHEDVHEKGTDSLIVWRDKQVARLDDVVRQMNAGLPELEGCSPMASDILRTYVTSQYLENICRYYLLTDMDSVDREAYWREFFTFLAPREQYLLDNPLLMISADDFFFNRMEFTVMRPMHTSKRDYLPFNYDSAIAPLIASEKRVYRREARRKVMDELHEKLYLSPTNFTAQVCQMRDLTSALEWIGNDYDIAADEVASALSVITNPELMRRAVLTYHEYVKENELKVAEEKPLTKGDSIFQRIIEPYKGNILYIDFWAMYCGPCRENMISMRGELEANKDKPVKYLYITSDTPDKCRQFIESNNIKGEHIHITPSEWGYLQEKFQFSAIPFVVFLDKQGNLRKDNVTVEQLLNE